MRWLLFASLLCAGSATAHELLSWWNRDLLPVRLEPGDWVEIASLEEFEGESYADTLRCEVLRGEGTRRWLDWRASHGLEHWVIEIDVARMGESESVLDLVQSLHRLAESGRWEWEPVDELAQSAIVRGRLEDAFEDPTITRSALGDSVVEAATLQRERIVLHEERERKIALGRQSMNYAWTRHSDAVLSPDVPIFGVLVSESYTEESTQRFDAEGSALGPPSLPQRNASWLRCLRFGSGVPRGLPSGLELPGQRR